MYLSELIMIVINISQDRFGPLTQSIQASLEKIPRNGGEKC
jgi:hypothetical protein